MFTVTQEQFIYLFLCVCVTGSLLFITVNNLKQTRVKALGRMREICTHFVKREGETRKKGMIGDSRVGKF